MKKKRRSRAVKKCNQDRLKDRRRVSMLMESSLRRRLGRAARSKGVSVSRFLCEMTEERLSSPGGEARGNLVLEVVLPKGE